jgi:hypothetical protein
VPIAPATQAEFQWFSGLGVKAAKGVLEPLKLVDVGGGRLMFEADREAFEGFEPPPDPQYAPVGSLDALVLLRRDVAGLLDVADARRKLATVPSEFGGLSDLPAHAIFDRGRLVGLWEYDPESASIAWWAFGVKDAKKNKALRAAIERTEAFVRDEVGDARSFSLDSPKSRAPRIDALRRATG